MADFYWSGIKTGVTSGTAGTPKGLTAYEWHNQDNWFIRVAGSTGNSFGGSADVGYYFESATRVPRKDDKVFFDLLGNDPEAGLQGGPWPKNPCLYGGWCGAFPHHINGGGPGSPNAGATGYWLGSTGSTAEVTGNLRQVTVTERYSGQFINMDPPTSRRVTGKELSAHQLPVHSFSYPLGSIGDRLDFFPPNGWSGSNQAGATFTFGNSGETGPGKLPSGLAIKTFELRHDGYNLVSLSDDSFIRRCYVTRDGEMRLNDSNVILYVEDRALADAYVSYTPEGEKVESPGFVTARPEGSNTKLVNVGFGSLCRITGLTGAYDIFIGASGAIPQFDYAPRFRYNAEGGDSYRGKHQVAGDITTANIYPQERDAQVVVQGTSEGLNSVPQSPLNLVHRVNSEKNGPWTITNLNMKSSNTFYGVQLGIPSNKSNSSVEQLRDLFNSNNNKFNLNAGVTIENLNFDGGSLWVGTDIQNAGSNKSDSFITIVDADLDTQPNVPGSNGGDDTVVLRTYSPSDPSYTGFQIGASVGPLSAVGEEGARVVDPNTRVQYTPGMFVTLQWLGEQGGNTGSEGTITKGAQAFVQFSKGR